LNNRVRSRYVSPLAPGTFFFQQLLVSLMCYRSVLCFISFDARPYLAFLRRSVSTPQQASLPQVRIGLTPRSLTDTFVTASVFSSVFPFPSTLTVPPPVFPAPPPQFSLCGLYIIGRALGVATVGWSRGWTEHSSWNSLASPVSQAALRVEQVCSLFYRLTRPSPFAVVFAKPHSRERGKGPG